MIILSYVELFKNKDSQILRLRETNFRLNNNTVFCRVELNVDAREMDGELYCLRCHDKMGIPICGACR